MTLQENLTDWQIITRRKFQKFLSKMMLDFLKKLLKEHATLNLRNSGLL